MVVINEELRVSLILIEFDQYQQYHYRLVHVHMVQHDVYVVDRYYHLV